MEEENLGGDTMISDFATYEDFLDAQITVADLFYLEVRETNQYSHLFLNCIHTQKMKLQLI